MLWSSRMPRGPCDSAKHWTLTAFIFVANKREPQAEAIFYHSPSTSSFPCAISGFSQWAPSRPQTRLLRHCCKRGAPKALLCRAQWPKVEEASMRACQYQTKFCIQYRSKNSLSIGFRLESRSLPACICCGTLQSHRDAEPRQGRPGQASKDRHQLLGATRSCHSTPFAFGVPGFFLLQKC